MQSWNWSGMKGNSKISNSRGTKNLETIFFYLFHSPTKGCGFFFIRVVLPTQILPGISFFFTKLRAFCLILTPPLEAERKHWARTSPKPKLAGIVAIITANQFNVFITKIATISSKTGATIIKKTTEKMKEN